jgi:hypothetical protein
MIGGSVVLGGAAATLIAVATTAGLNSGAATGIEFMALAGLGMFAAGALRVSGWARRRKTQMDEVIARLVNSVSRSDRALPRDSAQTIATR